jgi:hypothetical protein
MLEELCRNSFYRACFEKKHKEGLVYLKGRPRPAKLLENFQIEPYLRQDWHFLPIQQFCGRGKCAGSEKRMAWVWFNEHADHIRDSYIEKEYGGDIGLAMMFAGSFDTLFAEFRDYFSARRKEFMEKTENTMAVNKTALSKQGKSPQSHGGVANLLKVLTKTMHDQGSSIYSIAKVQYAVCMQAGIYIPEEFLTDVLVASEIMDGDTNG